MPKVETRIRLPVRRIPRPARARRRPRRLHGRRQGRRPRERRDLAAGRRPGRRRPPRLDRRPPRRAARDLRARRRRLRDALPRQGPVAAADEARAAAEPAARTRSPSSSRAATPASSTSPAGCPRPPSDKIKALDIAGIDLTRRVAAHLPARHARRRRSSAPSASTAAASSASSTRATTCSAAATASSARSSTAVARRSRSRTCSRAKPGRRLRLTLDAEVQERTEEVLQGVGADLPAQGRDRDRHGPAQRRAARRRQLAADRRQRARQVAGLGAAEPGRRLHLRAGLDLQGLHRRRRARGRRGHAAHRRSTCRRRSRSPTA